MRKGGHIHPQNSWDMFHVMLVRMCGNVKKIDLKVEYRDENNKLISGAQTKKIARL